MNLAKPLPLIFFAISYGVVVFFKGWSVGLYTLIVGVSALISAELFGSSEKTRKIIAYTVFFLTPFLTAIGQIGALTGFGRSDVAVPWNGIAFATSGIAFQVYQGRLRFTQLFGSILQPLRLISGPVALSFKPLKELNFQRFQVYVGWIILGSFFYWVLAAGIAPLLILKQSTESLDVLFFAVIFEFYVYLNFCGISLIVFGVMNLIGVRTTVNFDAPFSSRNLIEYWKRWHISFSGVLKEMFFKPTRKVFGMTASVLAVFTASAMWHGITLNFFIWGFFHAIGWLLTYYLYQFKWGRIGRLAVIKKAINIVLLVVFVVVGRLLFSEDDSQVLWIKLSSLLNFAWSPDALILNMSLDTRTSLMVTACFGIILLEIFFPKKMFQYKMLREKKVSLVLLILTLALGSSGVGSVYGSR